jgi:hypothetical protein
MDMDNMYAEGACAGALHEDDVEDRSAWDEYMQQRLADEYAHAMSPLIL